MLVREAMLLALVACCRWVTTRAWQQEATLDERGHVVLFWTADVKKNVLMVEIQGRTLGYIALGISPNGTMENADLLIGYVDYLGEAHVLDYWASKNGPPILDESQDWKLLAGRQNDTHTMIRVRRPITPNTPDDINVFDFPTWVLWAWHPHDPGEDLHPEYHHNNRGARRLCLLRLDCWPPPRPDSAAAAASSSLLLLFTLLPRLL
ncbi:DBH-like monooxygenase protein 1 [Procambarus clarkii]|uniref:DBH-like monooxygenase protein 1 n=1 Tax=Procambarus clarkii TaxID=6728 RepID=UPI001E6787CC|nr:DBH-like monooxygenase protein 1 [Procambarus clarkii]